MQKPIIILSPQQMPMEKPYKGKYSYSNSFNTSALINAGALPLIPPFLEAEDAECLLSSAQGLFLTGGGDISSRLYGEKALKTADEVDEARDRNDFFLLKAALKLHKPVLCICRGMQLANVYFGGSLYQDLDSQFKSSIKHSQWSYPEYKLETAHEIKIVDKSPLHFLLGKNKISVNSLHHQAVKALGVNLVPMAFSTDGLVESFYLKSELQWLRAYQWHPEMLENAAQTEIIFKDFISACIERK